MDRTQDIMFRLLALTLNTKTILPFNLAYGVHNSYGPDYVLLFLQLLLEMFIFKVYTSFITIKSSILNNNNKNREEEKSKIK